MTTAKIISTITATASVAMLFLATMQSDSLAIEGNEVGKRAFFAIASLAISFVALLNLRRAATIRLSVADLAISALTLYVFIGGMIGHWQARGELTMIGLLAALYFNLRIIIASDPKLMLAMITGMFLLFGVAQGAMGLWQLLGYGTSNHGFYNITGSFFNPGPFGGYMAIVGVVSAAILAKNYPDGEKFNTDKLVFVVAAIALCVSVLVLPASMSRTAWVAFAAGLVVVGFRNRLVKSIVASMRWWWFVVIGVVGIAALVGTYNLKSQSADGRLLMWKVSARATADKPVMGHGLSYFPSVYANAQAEYFEYHTGEELVAGSPEYAFNEYLQIAIELGYLGLLLFLIAVVAAVRTLLKSPVVSQSSLGIGLIALLVFALGSYPFSLMPFLIFLTVALAAASTNERGLLLNAPSKIALALFCLLLCVWGSLRVDSQPYREWKKINMLYQAKQYQYVISEYEKLYPDLSDNPRFLFEYGHALGLAGEPQRAIEVLESGRRLSSDPMYYNVMGNNYKDLGDTARAERCYRQAYRILPSRIYPLYLLVKLHHEHRDTVRTIEVGKLLLSMPDKVSSPASRDIRHEVRAIIDSYDDL